MKGEERHVLVVGGGIAGITAALELASCGVKTTMLEEGPSIGGRMIQLDKTFPTLDCSTCTLSPKMVETALQRNIEPPLLGPAPHGAKGGQEVCGHGPEESALRRYKEVYGVRDLLCRMPRGHEERIRHGDRPEEGRLYPFSASHTQ